MNSTNFAGSPVNLPSPVLTASSNDSCLVRTLFNVARSTITAIGTVIEHRVLEEERVLFVDVREYPVDPRLSNAARRYRKHSARFSCATTLRRTLII